jgi:hypothetical protein
MADEIEEIIDQFEAVTNPEKPTFADAVKRLDNENFQAAASVFGAEYQRRFGNKVEDMNDNGFREYCSQHGL